MHIVAEQSGQEIYMINSMGIQLGCSIKTIVMGRGLRMEWQDPNGCHS